ncbi:MAG: hypothetical protein ACR2RL_04310, partial [Gammaproteobacteria bacterium]
DVFLPIKFRYLEPTSNLNLVVSGRLVNPRAQRSGMEPPDQSTRPGQPLRIEVPTQGIHFAFEKLYANQSRQLATFTVRYLAAELGYLGWLSSGLGTILLWLGIVALWNRPRAVSGRAVAACLLAGVALLVLSIGYLEVGPTLPAVLTLVIVLIVLVIWLAGRVRHWRAARFARAGEP